MRREEDFHRKKDPVINIPLIQVYEEIDTFNTRKFADQDRICLDPASPYHLHDNFLFHGSLRWDSLRLLKRFLIDILRQDFKWPTLKEGKASVVPLETFKEQLDIFTEGQLKFIDWKNVFAAGGNVLLPPLSPPPPLFSCKHLTTRSFFKVRCWHPCCQYQRSTKRTREHFSMR